MSKADVMAQLSRTGIAKQIPNETTSQIVSRAEAVNLPIVLSGWKEIALYLRCGVRTVQRWEGYGLPIHRPISGKRAHVIAYTDELDWWARDHKPKAVPAHVGVSVSQARKLREQARKMRAELRVRIRTLRQEMARLRGNRSRYSIAEGLATNACRELDSSFQKENSTTTWTAGA